MKQYFLTKFGPRFSNLSLLGIKGGNFIEIWSDLAFLLYNVQGFTFLLDTVVR